MSWKVRAEAASSPVDTNGNGPDKPAGVRKHGTKRTKKAPQKCAERRQKVAKKRQKNAKKLHKCVKQIAQQISKKRAFSRYFAIFSTQFRGRFRRLFGLFWMRGAARLAQRPPSSPS